MGVLLPISPLHNGATSWFFRAVTLNGAVLTSGHRTDTTSRLACRQATEGAEMQGSLMRGLLFGVAGSIIGFGMGVAAFGTAVSGAVVFGPIGFIIGWMFPSGSPVATAPLTSPMVAPEPAAGSMV